MDKLLNYLKEKCSDLFEYMKIVDISYNKTNNILIIKIVYQHDFDFNDSHKNRIYTLVNQFLNVPNLKIDIKSKKSLVDKTSIIDLINFFLERDYASIKSTMQSDDISIDLAPDVVNVKIKIVSVFKDFLESKKFELDLKFFLERNYLQNFSVKVFVKQDVDDVVDMFNEHTKNVVNSMQIDTEEYKPVTYELLDVEEYIGNQVENIALATKCVKPSDASITVAGVIGFITKKTYVSKRKASQGIEKEYYNFVLTDNYGKINCVYFPTKDSKEKFEEIQEKTQIAVVGDAEEFNGRMNFKVKSISLCKLPEKEEEIVEEKTENKEYLFIKPEPYITMSQATLFDVVVENNNKFLKENDCVVFDFETTGLDANSCEIIEIGAVKVHDGKLSETFSCLIKPSKQIPSQITDITGISNDMVQNCFTINEVLQDFYKFTRNSVIVAYNIAFDYKFLYLAGKAQGYNFDNKQIDAMVLAQQKLKGIKNYKLKTVAAALEVSLENAHRAVHDAIATAEVFIKLVDSDTVL